MVNLRRQLVRIALSDDGVKEVQQRNPNEVLKFLYEYNEDKRTFVPTSESLILGCILDYYRKTGHAPPLQAFDTYTFPTELEANVKESLLLSYEIPLVLYDLDRIIDGLRNYWLGAAYHQIATKHAPSNLTDPIINLEGLLKDARRVISTARAHENPTAISITDLADEAVRLLAAKYDDPTAYLGLQTGFPTFDKKEGGLYKGTLDIVAGRMKSGKSTLLLTWASNIWATGKNVILINREMGIELQSRRLAAMHLTKDLIGSALWGTEIQRKLKTGDVTGPQLEAYYKMWEELKQRENKFFFTSPMSVRTLDDADELVNELCGEYGLDLVVLDSGNIASIDEGNDAWSQSDEQKRIAERMVEIALKYNVVCLVDVQTTRDRGNDPNAGLDCIALSDWWARTAHLITRIWPDSPSTASLQILASRDGPGNYSVPLLYALDQMLIKEMSLDEV